MMKYSNLKLVLMYLLALSVYFASSLTVNFKLKLYKNMMKYTNLKLVLMYYLALSVYFASSLSSTDRVELQVEVIQEYDEIFQLEVGSDVLFSVKRVFCFIFKFH